MLPMNSQTLSSGNHASALSSPAWCLLLPPVPGRLLNPLSHPWHPWGCRPESRGCAGAVPRMRALCWAHSQRSSLTVELHGPQAALPGAPNAFQGFFTKSVRGLAYKGLHLAPRPEDSLCRIPKSSCDGRGLRAWGPGLGGGRVLFSLALTLWLTCLSADFFFFPPECAWLHHAHSLRNRNSSHLLCSKSLWRICSIPDTPLGSGSEVMGENKQSPHCMELTV